MPLTNGLLTRGLDCPCPPSLEANPFIPGQRVRNRSTSEHIGEVISLEQALEGPMLGGSWAGHDSLVRRHSADRPNGVWVRVEGRLAHFNPSGLTHYPRCPECEEGYLYDDGDYLCEDCRASTQRVL